MFIVSVFVNQFPLQRPAEISKVPFFTVFSVCNERLNYGRPLCAYILSLKLFHLHALGDYILLLKS